MYPLYFVLLMYNIPVIESTISPPAPFQCPVPEDRAKAYYNGETCDQYRYSCCFSEVLNGNATTCCYAYGQNGPYKCCGSLSVMYILLCVFSGIMLLFAPIFIALCVIRVMCERGSKHVEYE